MYYYTNRYEFFQTGIRFLLWHFVLRMWKYSPSTTWGDESGINNYNGRRIFTPNVPGNVKAHRRMDGQRERVKSGLWLYQETSSSVHHFSYVYRDSRCCREYRKCSGKFTLSLSLSLSLSLTSYDTSEPQHKWATSRENLSSGFATR